MREQSVLIVDDDPQIRDILAIYFKKELFTVIEAADGLEAIRKAEQLNPSIILLDIMMPVLDGIEVCRQIRKFSRVPIIMLTARSEDDDRIMGLELGADDYITKPFNPREVVARVKAVLRMAHDTARPVSPVLRFSNLDIDINEHTITAFDQTISLTTKEIELLWCLASHPNRTFSRELLLEKVWDYTYCGETRTVDTHIKRLRQKLRSSDETPWDIKTVWGVGYRFEVRS